MIDLHSLINPTFTDIADSLLANEFPYTHLWLTGGRGSGKSSFAAFIVVTLIMRDGEWNKKGWIPDEMLTNAVVLRKFGNTLRESVFEQIASAINMLGVENLWERTYNPMQFIYKPTGQRILLRGLDDATKTKSIKVSKGRISLVWYEELEEFSGMTEIRKANQSFLRGGGTLHNYQVSINPLVIYSYNPPRTISSWVNEEALKKVPSRLVVKSCYTTMPPDWLGKEFIKEALELREIDLQSYKHEYLGEVVGVAGVIFRNIFGRKISDVEIRQFRNCLQGLDWGFGHPAAFTQSFYDYKQNDLYIYGEVVKQGLTNPELANEIKRLVKGDKRTQIIADCEDKKSIQEFRRMGFNIIPCRKHKASKGEIYGIKWMQKINHIYIDSERCPETYKAFCAYAYKQNKDGIYQDVLPELGEDPIDSVRYALQNFIYPPTFGIRK